MDIKQMISDHWLDFGLNASWYHVGGYLINGWISA
jgi:hypothetical protein